MSGKRRRWLIALTAALLAVVGVIVLMLTADPWTVRYADDLRDRGEPATWAEAVAPAVAADRNAAAELLAIYAEMFAPGAEVDLVLTAPWTETRARRRELVSRALIRHEGGCARIRELLEGRVVRLHAPALRGKSAPMEKGSRALRRFCSRAEEVLAAMPPEDGKAARALALHETLLLVGSAWEPVSTGQLGDAVVYDESVLYSVREALRDGRLKFPAAYERLAPLVRPRRVAQWLPLMRVERAHALDIHADRIARGPSPGKPQGAVDATLHKLWRWSAERTTLDRFAVMDRVISLGPADGDPVAIREALTIIVDSQRVVGPAAQPMAAFMCRGYLDDAIRIDVQREFARVALAAGAHRARTGAWPASIDELGGLLGDDASPGFRGYRFRLVVQDEDALVIHVTPNEGVDRVAPWTLPAPR